MEFSFKKKPKMNNELLTEEELAKRLLLWPESFYKEQSQKMRWQMLEEADRRGLTSGDNALRKKFFLARYPHFNKNADSEDLYLKAWMEFRFQSQNAGGFFKGRKAKDALRALRQMGYFDAKTEQEKRLLSEEIYHLGLLYTALCYEDKGYTSVLFGFGKMSDDSVGNKIRAEFKTVAIDTPAKLGIADECRLWTDSLLRAFHDIYPDDGL